MSPNSKKVIRRGIMNIIGAGVIIPVVFLMPIGCTRILACGSMEKWEMNEETR
jgi:hypothetical protein